MTPSVSISQTAGLNPTCVGGSVTYTATASNTGGGTVNYNFKVDGSSIQSSSSNSFTTTSLSTGTHSVTVDITVSSGACLSATTASSSSASITVNPNNTVGTASSSPTVCINTAISSITHTTTGATSIGTSTGLPAGVSASFASNTITISGTPTASGTFNYSIPLTGGCGTVSATGTITVKSPVTANAGSDQTVTGATVTLAGNNPTPGTGAWTIVGTPNDGTFGNATLYNTSFTGTEGKTYTLRWTVTNTPCAASSDDVTITLNPSAVGTVTTIDAASATYGAASVNLVAHVTPSAATGTVQFYVNGSATPAGTATLSGGTATFSYSLSGVNAGLYTLRAKYLGAGVYTASETDPETAGGLLIGKKSASVTANDKTKTYGDDNPALDAEVSGTVNGDVLNYTLATTATKYSGVNTYPITVSLGSNPNYEVTPTAGTLTIGKKTLTVALVGTASKFYDATSTATLTSSNYSLPGVVNSDEVILNNPATGTYIDKHVGTNKKVTVIGLSISGANAGNYVLSSTTANANIGTITVRPINVTAQTDTKVYDGTVNSSVIPVVDALQGTDAVTNAGSQKFNSKHVGTNKTLTPSGTIINDGNSGNNYAITYVNDGTGVITKKSINVTAKTATKVYDGDNSSTVVPVVDALATGDMITTQPVQTYDTKHVATGKTLTASGLVINDGNSGNNYQVTYVQNINGVITKKDIKVKGKVAVKVFDGNASSTVIPTIGSLQPNDVIATQPIQEYDNPNYGTNKVMTPNGLVINDGNNGGNYNIIYETDAVGTITQFQATTSITATPSPVQYSDTVRMTATISGGASLVAGGGPKAATTATFSIGGQVMKDGANNSDIALQVVGNDLVATLAVPLLETTVNGSMAPQSNKPVSVTFNGVNSNFALNTNPKTATINVIKEDATVDYTGDQLVSTGSSSVSTVTVTVRANISDITVTDAAGDPYPGDIRKAKVKFVVMLNNTPVTSTSWLSPDSLVVAGDKRIGMVKTTFQANLGSTTDAEYEVRVLVGVDGSDQQGYYAAESDPVIVTVYKPTGDFITGGGHIVNTNSEGSMKADAGTKTNFGFNVKLNKTGKNLQGNLNFIFRRKVGSVLRTYQVKANAMQSLAVNASNISRQTANFVSKCNMTDITNPNAPVSMGGNKYMYVNMVDNGDPGVKDSISFVLVDGTGDPTVLSNIQYSSHWVGNMTKMKNLGGGNLVVHSGFSVGSTTTTKATATINTRSTPTQVVVAEDNTFELKAYPNPSTSQFTVQLQSSNTSEKIQVRVTDLSGRTVQLFNNLSANQTLQIGATYRPGVYIVEMIQGSNRKLLKLLKQPD